jgi:hypothetical protein
MATGIIALLTVLGGIILWSLQNRKVKSREDILAERKADNDSAIAKGDAAAVNSRLDELLSRAKDRHNPG